MRKQFLPCIDDTSFWPCWPIIVRVVKKKPYTVFGAANREKRAECIGVKAALCRLWMSYFYRELRFVEECARAQEVAQDQITV